jgi:hypothetical protein
MRRESGKCWHLMINRRSYQSKIVRSVQEKPRDSDIWIQEKRIKSIREESTARKKGQVR